jgi:hypothetical protein
VVAELSAGEPKSIYGDCATGSVDFTLANLREPGVAWKGVRNVDVVCYAAADHGGPQHGGFRRPFPASNRSAVESDMWAADVSEVAKFRLGASGSLCLTLIGTHPSGEAHVVSRFVGPRYDPENEHRSAKLIAELALKGHYEHYRARAAPSCRGT